MAERFFTRTGRAEADRLFRTLDALFGEEGAPVATAEIDEAADIHEVSLYVEDASFHGGEGAIEGAFGAFIVEREILPDIDWMAPVLAGLGPVRAGRFLVHGAHDRHRVRVNDLAIEIEAGQAFGTGHHETTAGCLRMIDRLVRTRRPRGALDLGTGSAVLAIAIAKLAHVSVLATDIDPVAVRVARENVGANGVQQLVQTVVANGFRSPAFKRRKAFDLLTANILAGPLMRLAPTVARHLSPGGDLVLSGILARQRAGVLAAYRQQRLYHRATLRLGDWVTLHLTGRAAG